MRSCKWGYTKAWCVGSKVAFYSQDAPAKSRHGCGGDKYRFKEMDDWTLLSAGFDVGEEADGSSRTTAGPQMQRKGGSGGLNKKHKCERKGHGVDKIKEKRAAMEGTGALTQPAL